MSEWTECTLGDVVTLQRGYDLPSRVRRQGCYPVVSSSGTTDWHAEYKVEGPGVVTGRYGTIGEVFYVAGKYWPLNTTLFVSDFKGNVPRFVYYLLKLFDFKKFSDKSAVPGVNRNDLYPTKIRLPRDRETQESIALILHSLDDKIEHNNELIKMLEEQARLVYDYWFMQFDFPDENGRPYRSSGGKMVWNEVLKREIPEGWEAAHLSAVVNTCLGGTPDTGNREYWDGGDIPWLSSGDLAVSPLLKASGHITIKGLDNSAAKLMKKGTVAVSLVRYIRPSILGIDAAGNQSVVGLTPSDTYPTCFLYPYLKGEVPRLMSLRTGAQQPHINKAVIDESPIVVPSTDKIIAAYKAIVQPLYERYLCIAEELELVQQQRDFLLPLLMSGQVTVAD